MSSAVASTPPAKTLADRFAIVTGANRGLGEAIAGRFLAAGASLLLTARDGEILKRAAERLSASAAPGQRVVALAADVSNPHDCKKVVDRALELSDRIDILVNNAGIYGPMGPIEQVDWEQFVGVIRINLLGAVLMCRNVIPVMRRQGRGKIINLSGGGGAQPLPFIDGYALSKAAVVRFTENLAMELREAKIDVNAIAPGALNTRMLQEVLAAGEQKVGADFYRRALRQRDEGGAPLDKGAALAQFLAGSASDGITGRLISAVWDNWAELPQQREALAKSDIYTLRRIVPKDRGQTW